MCVEIPSEDVTDADLRHDKVGILRMSLYGTRDAAMNWQEEVAREMMKAGFRICKFNPCLYYNEGRNLRTFLHGEDFATVVTKANVKWRNVIEKQFEIKTECVSLAAVGLGDMKPDAPSGPSPNRARGQEPGTPATAAHAQPPLT